MNQTNDCTEAVTNRPPHVKAQEALAELREHIEEARELIPLSLLEERIFGGGPPVRNMLTEKTAEIDVEPLSTLPVLHQFLRELPREIREIIDLIVDLRNAIGHKAISIEAALFDQK